MLSSYFCLMLKPLCVSSVLLTFHCVFQFPSVFYNFAIILLSPFCRHLFPRVYTFLPKVLFDFFLLFKFSRCRSRFFWFLVLFRLILVLILALLWPPSFLFWLRWPGFACICNMIQPLLVLAGNSNRLYCMSASDKPITLHLHYNCWSIHLFPPPAIMFEVFFCARTRKPLSDATCSAVFVYGCECVSQPPRNKEGVHSTQPINWRNVVKISVWNVQHVLIAPVQMATCCSTLLSCFPQAYSGSMRSHGSFENRCRVHKSSYRVAAEPTSDQGTAPDWQDVSCGRWSAKNLFGQKRRALTKSDYF